MKDFLEWKILQEDKLDNLISLIKQKEKEITLLNNAVNQIKLHIEEKTKIKGCFHTIICGFNYKVTYLNTDFIYSHVCIFVSPTQDFNTVKEEAIEEAKKTKVNLISNR